MRFVFIGAGSLAIATIRLLIERNQEVVLVERDKVRIDALVDDLDCGFIHGDGSHPALLREAMPKQTDALFCLSGRDQDNIIASLVGRSLGFRKVITRIEDEELEHITLALRLPPQRVPVARQRIATAGGRRGGPAYSYPPPGVLARAVDTARRTGGLRQFEKSVCRIYTSRGQL